MTHRWGLLLLIPVVLLCGCVGDTLNVGTGSTCGDDGRWYIYGANIQADNWNAGERATFETSWSGGFPPYKLEIDLGTSKSQPAVNISGLYAKEHQCSFILEEGSRFNWSVTVTSSVGSVREEYGYYGPVGPPLNSAPEIVGAVYDEPNRVLTVSVADAEGDDVEVTVSEIDGLSVDQESQTVTGGNGTAEFVWYPDEVLIGGSGTTTVTVTSAASVPELEATRDVEITVAPMEISVGEGQLGIIPLETSIRVGDVLTVIVATGPFPAEAPFAYLNGLAVTVNDGGDYVPGTFNVGQVGGAAKDVDGIWAEMDPAPSTFFIPEDFMMAATDVTADSSLDFMWFNITPIHGGEVTSSGVLLNFGMEFDAEGTYALGYLEFQDVKRTYYSDSDGVEYDWIKPDGYIGPFGTITVN